ncbi:MAG: NAD-dependent deacylase [Phycisphaerae bacterium]
MLDELAELLRRSRFVCAMTGAGVSAESGLATFRGPDGLWKGRDPAEVATPEAFARDPSGVWEFYNWRLRQAARVQPNPGHHALATLEIRLPGFGLVTQNVDRLHQLAGSRRVVELHGNIDEVRCVSCSFAETVGRRELPAEPRCPKCRDWLRPCVVWFGEMLPADAVRRATDWAERCDVFMSIGTSATVWPASEFAHTAKQRGAALVEINLEPTSLTRDADLAIHGKTGELLPMVVERLAGGAS